MSWILEGEAFLALTAVGAGLIILGIALLPRRVGAVLLVGGNVPVLAYAILGNFRWDPAVRWSLFLAFTFSVLALIADLQSSRKAERDRPRRNVSSSPRGS